MQVSPRFEESMEFSDSEASLKNSQILVTETVVCFSRMDQLLPGYGASRINAPILGRGNLRRM
jgi:hypothetical protein